MSVLLPAVKSTGKLFEGELGETDHQQKCRLIYEWICMRMKNNKITSWGALIVSKTLGGGSTMYEYPLKTLIESGQVMEISNGTKKITCMCLQIRWLNRLKSDFNFKKTFQTYLEQYIYVRLIG